jgi:hypothetical protein
MPLLRLAYTTQFLIALIAIFVVWGQVGGQSHLELVPWYLKLVFGGGSAFAAVRATVAAVGHERPWNGPSLRWLGVMIALLVCCGLASYIAHMNEEPDEDNQPETGSLPSAAPRARPAALHALFYGLHKVGPLSLRARALHPGKVRQRAPAGSFGAHFGDHNAVAFVKKLAQNILELGSRMGAVQRPLIGQHRLRFESAQPRFERSVIAFVEQVARDQI